MEWMRLNKYLAACGVCSRREADRWIDEGAVTVNGQPAQTGMQVDGSEEILFHGKPVIKQEKKVLLLYNKPVGVVCTQRDSHAEKTIATEVDYPVRVTYAGRLDKNSKGLLLLTNDGDLIDEMMRGRNGHEKEYLVKVNQSIRMEDLRKMEQGIWLEELEMTTKPCKTRKIGDKSFRIILTQGLNRQIRRMCESLGYRVVSLQRLRVANLTLGDLPEGQYREATDAEMDSLWESLRIGSEKETADGEKGIGKKREGKKENGRSGAKAKRSGKKEN